MHAARVLYWLVVGTLAVTLGWYFVVGPVVHELADARISYRRSNRLFERGLCPDPEDADEFMKCTLADDIRRSYRVTYYVRRLFEMALCLGERRCYLGPVAVSGTLYRTALVGVLGALVFSSSGVALRHGLSYAQAVERCKLPTLK